MPLRLVKAAQCCNGIVRAMMKDGLWQAGRELGARLWLGCRLACRLASQALAGQGLAH